MRLKDELLRPCEVPSPWAFIALILSLLRGVKDCLSCIFEIHSSGEELLNGQVDGIEKESGKKFRCRVRLCAYIGVIKLNQKQKQMLRSLSQ
jgi:hypothetical protein